MKKNKLIILLGLFILITYIIIKYNKVTMYDKQINYNSTTEIIDILNTKVLAIYDSREGYKKMLTKDYQECLSKRKRITGDNMKYDELDLDINKEINDNIEYKNKIKNSYLESINNLSNYKTPEEIQIVSLIGTGKISSDNYNYNYVDNKNMEKIMLDIIFINEGEGLVIDAYYFTYIENEEVEEDNYYDLY